MLQEEWTLIQWIQMMIGAAVVGGVIVSSKEVCQLITSKVFKRVTQNYMTEEMCMAKRSKCWREREKEDLDSNDILKGILKALITLISYSNIPEDKKNDVYFQLKGLNKHEPGPDRAE